jgi:hypothetical protein
VSLHYIVKAVEEEGGGKEEERRGEERGEGGLSNMYSP